MEKTATIITNSRNFSVNFEYMLLTKKENLEGWLKAQIQDRQKNNPSDLEMEDVASFYAVEQTKEARVEEELADVKEAIERWGNGIYGFCKDCGKEIPEARLILFPAAKRCCPCQSKHRPHINCQPKKRTRR